MPSPESRDPKAPAPGRAPSSDAPATGVTKALSFLLKPFGEVQPSEAVTTLSLTATVFVILMSYYLLKVVREPLILQGGGAEVKSYAAVGQAALLIVVSRGYAWLVKRLGRMPLTAGVFLGFTACVLGFLALSRTSVPIGVPFYLFVGIFSLTIIAQFWSFANDIHNDEQGKRIFAVVNIGSSVGAVVGSELAGKLFKVVGVSGLLTMAAGFLGLSLGGLFLVNHLVAKQGDANDAPPSSRQADDDRKAKEAAEQKGIAAILGSNFDRYLWLIAAMLLLLNAANSNGEYILDRTLTESTKHLDAEAAKQAIAEFKGKYFFGFNLIGMLLQLFVTSRLIKFFGLRVALFVFPVIALGGNLTMLFLPLLNVMMIAKVAENSVDYSIQSTCNQALYLVTSREAKYASKNFIDTFVVRAGDVTSAGIVLLGSTLHFPTKAFIIANVIVIGLLLVIVTWLGRENAKRAEALGHKHDKGDDRRSDKAPGSQQPVSAGALGAGPHPPTP